MTQASPIMPSEWPEGARLLLGLGAQKAGTTWVHSVLAAHPDCKPGPMKELHYFDSVFGLGGGAKRKREQALKALVDAGKGDGPRARRIRRLEAAIASPADGHAAYLALMGQGVKAGQVAMDITPSYGRMPAKGFAQMAALPASHFLFLMREPVARMWSSLRMQLAKQASDAGFEALCREGLDRALDSDPALLVARFDYASTLRNLHEHVPASRRLVLFFETLFTQGSVDQIHDFLGLSHRPIGNADARNVGQPATMRPDQVARLTEIFRHQYDAVCAMYGDTVPDAWHRRFAPSAAAA